MNGPNILIAGVGNIFFGDDAFGVEVAQRLARRPFPDGVRVVDFGIRGLDLAYTLLDGHDAVILVDAAPRGGVPGRIYVLELGGDAAATATGEPLIEAHSMQPAKVLQLVAALGGAVRRLLLVGCEPTPPRDADDMPIGLSAAVQAAVDEAIPLIEGLVTRLLAETRPDANSTKPKEVHPCLP
jgi:hydrogenase maturation protease